MGKSRAPTTDDQTEDRSGQASDRELSVPVPIKATKAATKRSTPSSKVEARESSSTAKSKKAEPSSSETASAPAAVQVKTAAKAPTTKKSTQNSTPTKGRSKAAAKPSASSDTGEQSKSIATSAKATATAKAAAKRSTHDNMSPPKRVDPEDLTPNEVLLMATFMADGRVKSHDFNGPRIDAIMHYCVNDPGIYIKFDPRKESTGHTFRRPNEHYGKRISNLRLKYEGLMNRKQAADEQAAEAAEAAKSKSKAPSPLPVEDEGIEDGDIGEAGEAGEDEDNDGGQTLQLRR